MTGQSLLTSININLVVPVFIVFALVSITTSRLVHICLLCYLPSINILFPQMRIKSAYNVALRLISGLRFFTQRRFAAISKTPTANPTTSDILEKSIAQLNLTMIELDDSMATKYVLRTQLFYDLFEAMVNLGLAGFLAYVWSMNYHCAVPDAIPSCWVVLLLLTLAAFAFQCLLQVLFMTGWRARESKMAAIVGLVTFLVSFGLFYVDLSYVSTDTATAIAVHINALMQQISRDMPTVSLLLLVPAVQAALSGFLGLMATGLVIPAIRYTQAIDTMVFGVRAAIVSSTDKIMLWVDFALPLAVAFVFSPLPLLLVRLVFPKYGAAIEVCNSESGNNGTCSSVTAEQAGAFNNALMTVQMVLCGAMLVLRVLCMKKHLQCFLDSVVRVVSAHLIATNAGHAPDQSMLMPKVKVRAGCCILSIVSFDESAFLPLREPYVTTSLPNQIHRPAQIT